jgi:hypothetical protein
MNALADIGAPTLTPAPRVPHAPARTVPGARVPVEWFGRSRVLRDSLIRPAGEAANHIEEMIRPLRPRPGFTPMPRYTRLRDIVRRWSALPGHGRLGCITRFEDGKLRLAEIRVCPATMKLAHWDGDPELAVCIVMRAIRCAPPVFSEEKILVADIGFHALARRFERGVNRSDAAVLADLAPIAHAYRQIVALPGEFSVRVEGGSWKGMVSLVAGKPCATIRTFVGDE